MKRFLPFLFLPLLGLPCAAQEASRDPAASGGPAPVAEDVRDLEGESAEWALAGFALLERDATMCDAGTALHEDALRGQAMREHPEWPIWAVDLALDRAREAYLRTLLFSK